MEGPFGAGRGGAPRISLHASETRGSTGLGGTGLRRPEAQSPVSPEVVSMFRLPIISCWRFQDCICRTLNYVPNLAKPVVEHSLKRR